MSYDHWKTTNPDDEWLGSAQQSPDPRELEQGPELPLGWDDDFFKDEY